MSEERERDVGELAQNDAHLAILVEKNEEGAIYTNLKLSYGGRLKALLPLPAWFPMLLPK